MENSLCWKNLSRRLLAGSDTCRRYFRVAIGLCFFGSSGRYSISTLTGFRLAKVDTGTTKKNKNNKVYNILDTVFYKHAYLFLKITTASQFEQVKVLI